MNFINELVEKLESKKIQMKKSTKAQMQKLLSTTFCNHLPRAYIEFMSVMGNGTEGQYMGGDSCFMDEVFNLKQGAMELLNENNSVNMLSDDDFVFWMSQGCMFCFFKISEGDNPPVYFYNESGEDRFIKIADSIVEFFLNRLEINPYIFKEKQKK